jgi:glycosyltransferase involved in cell wall biosynthesis
MPSAKSETLLVQEGSNGYLVAPDPEQIAPAVLELLNSPQRLAANAVACREFAAKFDWDLVASQYEQLYASQLNARDTCNPEMSYFW